MPTIFTHQTSSQHYDQVATNHIGSTAVSTVFIAAGPGGHTASFTFAVTKPTGSAGNVKTFSYSYDGIIHLESYVSDV